MPTKNELIENCSEHYTFGEMVALLASGDPHVMSCDGCRRASRLLVDEAKKMRASVQLRRAIARRQKSFL